MKGEVHNQQTNVDEMSAEYDFTCGVRGKHFDAYQRGHQVVVHKTDGTTEVREFALPEGVVVLAPDVRAYFPDSEAVNRALRGLLTLLTGERTPSEAIS